MIKPRIDDDSLGHEEMVAEIRPWFGNDFRPGLRPRGHEDVLGTALAPSHGEEVAHLGEDAESRNVEQQLCEVKSDPRKAARLRGGGSGQDVEGSGTPRDATPLVSRPEQAHREVMAFEPGNPHQAELRLLLLAILENIFGVSPGEAQLAAKPATLVRWWGTVEVYRRVLTSPEMASTRARAVVTKLLELSAEQLTEQRLAYVLGRRKSKRPAKRRKKKRRRRPTKDLSHERTAT